MPTFYNFLLYYYSFQQLESYLPHKESTLYQDFVWNNQGYANIPQKNNN